MRSLYFLNKVDCCSQYQLLVRKLKSTLSIMQQCTPQKPDLRTVVERVNNFLLPTSSRPHCTPFIVGDRRIGFITPNVRNILENYPDVFKVTSKAVHMNESLNTYDSRSAAMAKVLSTLRENHDQSLKALKGWRNECYNVWAMKSEAPLFKMERSGTGVFGVATYGCHINGYTYNDEGEMFMWMGQRSPTKQTYPNCYDNFVAGGLSAGLGLRECAEKECQEEASVSDEHVKKLKSGGTISYVHECDLGLFPEVEYVFDLELPQDFTPVNTDGEVQGFQKVPISKITEMIVENTFKPNSAMVVLDFLIRHGLVHPDNEPSYCYLVEMMHFPVQKLFSPESFQLP